MIRILVIGIVLLTTVIIAACGGGKQAASNTSTATAVADEFAPPKTAVPSCILKMIDSSKALADGTGITEVRRYLFNGARVYLVGAPCCDQYNPVYDSACNYLFAPSGGFTGKGDRSQPNFFTEAKEDSLIWRKK